MKMLNETQPQSNTNFFEDLDCNTLPRQFVKCLPRKFNGNILLELPPSETTHLLVFFKMNWHHDGHDKLEAQHYTCVQSDLPIGPHDHNV